MMRSVLMTLPAVWGALVISAAAPARAATQACASIFVDADAGVLARWPELPERIREAFAERHDVDRCARVHLGLRDGSIELAVSLPDGRSASRLARPEAVVPGLEALLLVPRSGDELPPEPGPAPPTGGTSTHFEPTAIAVVRNDPAPTSVAASPRRFAVELSLATSVRIGDGQTSAGLGATSFLDAASWLVGFGARVDSYGGSAVGQTGDSPTALEVEALVGRRFRFGTWMLDAVAGPALALRGDWSVMPANTASAGTTSSARSSSSHGDLVPRGLVRGRLTLGARSTVRTFVGVEGELGEAGPVPPGATRGLPSWGAGAALGVTVGTL
jgi:hypothetical protein